jgi:hypothetical protein
VPLRNRPHDEQAQAAALGAQGHAGRHAVEPPEDPLQLLGGDADAAVDDAHRQPPAVRLLEPDGDGDLLGGVLHGVVDQVPDGGAELVRLAEHERTAGADPLVMTQRVVVEVEPRARQCHALAHDLAEIDRRTAAAVELGAGPGTAGPQHLLDGVQQPVAVVEHDAVELLPPGVVEVARLQGLEVEPDGSDRRLELVGDRVDERVVLLVAADLADQKDRVQHHAGDDQQEEDHPQHRQQPHPPVQHDPADVEGDGNRHETDAEDGEEDHRPPAASHHGERIT